LHRDEQSTVIARRPDIGCSSSITGEQSPRTIDMGSYVRPHGMRFLPGDAKLVVTSEATQRVVVVNVASGTVDTTIATIAT
jgi:hypothetical protein